MIEHTVPDSVGAMTLPRYFRRAWPLMPGWVIRDAEKKKQVRLNGARWDGKAPVRGGDVLHLYIEEKYLTGAVKVLHEDGRLLAVEKPQGLPVDVDADGVGADTLLTRVHGQYPAARLCHRLDAGTGGAVLLALTGDAEKEMREAFERHLVKKTYRAVVKGCPGNAGTLTHFLLKNARDAYVTVHDEPRPGALKAVLDWRLVHSSGDRSLVEIDLHTGRTHQIRCQMAHIGCPLLGDDKYGDRAFNKCYGAVFPALWCVHLGYGNLSVDSAAPFSLEDEE